MADPTINFLEKPEMMTIDEVGEVVPAHPRTASCKEVVSWYIWCDACSKIIRDELSSTAYARTLSELHREENPGHPKECIIVLVHVDYTEEVFRT